MIDSGLCRNEVNKRVRHVLRAFKWAVGEEMVPPSVHHGLRAVSGLRRGQSNVRESETSSSRVRFLMPGLHRPVVSPGPVSALLWPLGFAVVDSNGRTVGAWMRSPGGCGSPLNRPDAASMRPSWPGCWPWNGSRVASCGSPSWISRSRRPGRSVGRCMVLSLGVGGSWSPDSLESHSWLLRSVGYWRVGGDRPISSWHWGVGPSSASPGSRPPGAWMSWSGQGWSLSIGRLVDLRLLQYLTSTRGTVDAARRVN